ncbi:MAG: hypothetical protein ABI574_04720 [Burkholderiales bacterium]
MNKTGAGRLLTLAAFLETLPRSVFDIERWAGVRYCGGSAYMPASLRLPSKRGRKGITPAEMRSCGAAACALGWAATIEPLAGRGLRINKQDFPEYSGLIGYDAGALFFGISLRESEFLFSPNKYSKNPSPKTVAKRIRALCDKAGWVEAAA